MEAIAASEPVCVAPMKALLGEGPLWDPRINMLAWVDIKGAKVFTYEPETNESAVYDAPHRISALGLAAEGGYVCASDNGFGYVRIGDGACEFRKIIDPEADLPGNRFNDGKVDPLGGFWAGSMDDAESLCSGGWWRLDPAHDVARLDKNFMVANGPAFDPERGRVFLTDSAARRIYVAETDGASFERKDVFLEIAESDGFPDGMEVDRCGFLWAAFWDGGAVRCYDPDGGLAATVKLPAPRPTSVAIVNDALYVTTASIGLSDRQLRDSPYSGGLFRIPLSKALGRDSPAFFGQSACKSAP